MINNLMDDATEVMEHDLAFHLEIAKAAKNPVFTLIVGAFDGVTRQTWPIGWRSRQTAEEQIGMLDLHRELARNAVSGVSGSHGYSPAWYSGSDFSSRGFSSGLSAMAAGMSAAMIAAQPASSSSSGFSGGGGGGGGGSGGGGGGGGGGGW